METQNDPENELQTKKQSSLNSEADPLPKGASISLDAIKEVEK